MLVVGSKEFLSNVGFILGFLVSAEIFYMTDSANNQRFTTYNEFFTFYLEQHSSPGNRLMHACGTLLGLAVLIVAIATRHFVWALLWIPIGYGFAWAGHFLIEGNKPATFGHPWWSFISDFRMLGLMLSGKLGRQSRSPQ